jgi:hypothetical protein
MFFKPHLAALCFSVILSHMFCRAADGIVINELMQSNIDCVFVDHEFPDSWVELYNGSSDSISLVGYRIGLENDFDSAYKLPDTLGIGGGAML